MKHTTKVFLLLLSLFACSSCVTQKKLAYFHNVNAAAADSINSQKPQYEDPVIHTGDQLLITVNALDGEAAAPFNLPIVSYITPGPELATTTPSQQSYIVDKEGNILFPILGKVHLEGKTKSEAIQLLTDRISASLRDPIVSIRFLNFNVTVIGEVNRPGNTLSPAKGYLFSMHSHLLATSHHTANERMYCSHGRTMGSWSSHGSTSTMQTSSCRPISTCSRTMSSTSNPIASAH